MKNLIIRDKLHEISSKIFSANNLMDALKNSPESRDIVLEALFRIWPRVYLEINDSIDKIRNEVPKTLDENHETK